MMKKIKIVFVFILVCVLCTQNAWADLTLSVLDTNDLGSVVLSEGSVEPNIAYYAPATFANDQMSVDNDAVFTRTLYQVQTEEIGGDTYHVGRLVDVSDIAIGQSGDPLYDWIMAHPTEVPLLSDAIATSQVTDYSTVPAYQQEQIVQFGAYRYKLQDTILYNPQPYIWYGAAQWGLEGALKLGYPYDYHGYHSNDYSNMSLGVPAFYIRIITDAQISGANVLLWITDLYFVRDYTTDPLTVWPTVLDHALFKSKIEAEDSSAIAAEIDTVLRAVGNDGFLFTDVDNDAVSAAWSSADDIAAYALFGQAANIAQRQDLNSLTISVSENLTLDCGSNVDLDNNTLLTAGTPVTNTTTCHVTTNDQDGYTLSLTNDRGAENTLYHTTNNTTQDGQIQDKTPWDNTNPNATNWENTGLGFGILSSTATKNESWWGTANTCNDTNQLYAGIPQSDTPIMQHDTYSNTQTDTTICYKLDIPSTQLSGEYTGSVTYTASGRP